jgi:hypothetical protein
VIGLSLSNLEMEKQYSYGLLGCLCTHLDPCTLGWVGVEFKLNWYWVGYCFFSKKEIDGNECSDQILQKVISGCLDFSM